MKPFVALLISILAMGPALTVQAGNTLQPTALGYSEQELETAADKALLPPSLRQALGQGRPGGPGPKTQAGGGPAGGPGPQDRGG